MKQILGCRMKKIVATVSLCALLATSGAGVFPMTAHAAVDGALSFDQANVSVNVGDTVTLVARVDPGTNEVGAVALDVTFDQTVLRLDSITRSAAFNTTLAGPTINNTNGTGALDVALLTGPATYITVPSDVATFVFTSLAAGNNSPVNFAVTSNASAHGSSVVATRTGSQVTVIDAGGTNPPTLAEVTPVPTPATDTTPSYTFSTSLDGTISYPDPSCSSLDTDATGGNNTITFEALSEGTYADCKIRVDTAPDGYAVLAVSSFTIDTSGPSVAISAPTSGATVRGAAVTVSATATDALTSVAGVQFKLDGVNIGAEDTSSPFSISWDSTTATNVSHDLTAVARDAVGNTTTSALVTVTVDNQAPTLAEVTPVSTPTNDVTPAYTFSSDEEGVITYGGDCSSADTTAEADNNVISFNTLAEGAHTNCTVRVTDAAGNASSWLDVTDFTIDSTGPVRSAGAPSGTLALGTTDTTLSLTTNENATCKYDTVPDTAYASMANTFTTTGTTTHSEDISGLTDSTDYNYYVRCQDTSLNVNGADYAITFSVASPDTTGPVISTPTLSNKRKNSIAVSWTTNEAANTRVEYGKTASYGATTVLTSTLATSHSVALDGLSSGTTYHYRVVAIDALNNQTIGADQTFKTNSDSDSGGSSSKKKKPTPRKISQSKKSVLRGQIVIQRGSKFSKVSKVALYFSKVGGGYYPPTIITTTKAGSFSLAYKAMKPKGAYKWYAVDLKTGKKSKVYNYTIR